MLLILMMMQATDAMTQLAPTNLANGSATQPRRISDASLFICDDDDDDDDLCLC